MNYKLYFFVFLIIMQIHSQSHNAYTVKLITGKELYSILPFIANQRLIFFQKYPYLYKGTMQEEYNYLNWFSELPHSACAIAYKEDIPVGFLTGTSFIDFDEHFNGSNQLFEKYRLDPYHYYYFSEIIILPEHRGKNLSQKLFKVLEYHAQTLGYKAGCFVAEHHETHPLKPENYRDIDSLFIKLGYTKSLININFSWPTIQPNETINDQEHLLTYWLKDFII